MKIAQLKTLVKHGESERLEFKNSTGSIPAGMQTVCAFLNSDHGGIVVFGVKDNGQIIGQTVTDKTRKEIGFELSKIEPSVKIDVIYVPVDNDRKVIVLVVNPGEKIPYTYDGRAFIRKQSTTMRMTKEEYAYLHNKHNPTIWESLPNDVCKIADLDRTRIKDVVRMAISENRLTGVALSENVPSLLTKLKLMVDGKLTNAAVVLFCKNENKQFIQSNLKLARFKGFDKREFLDNKAFIANAFDLYDTAMDFLHFALPVAARIEEGNPIRVETPAIPYTVLREAVTNALVHRDYSNAGGSLSIAIYDDRVNISNIGSLPLGVSINELSKQHESIQRNPLIAHIFYICGKIERWGRGTLDMIQDCKKAGNPLPQFEETGRGFSVTLPLKEPIRSIIETRLQKIDLSTLTDRQKKILHALEKGPLRSKQIMDAIHVTLTNRVMQLELGRLKNMGFIKSKGKTQATLYFLVEKITT